MSENTKIDPALEQRAVNTIRALTIDAVEASGDGHPGMPMGAAAMGYTLFTRAMRYNPKNSKWPNRDRYVQSAGHGSMLQYSLLHLAGYDLSMDDLRNYRQWESRTPGHPEYGHTDGVETTTGPLGQGIATAVGMAMAERRAVRMIALRTWEMPGSGTRTYSAADRCASMTRGVSGPGALSATITCTSRPSTSGRSESSRRASIRGRL